jgi:rhodanese-related sulfurtransferase
MHSSISSNTLKTWLSDAEEIALFDVREAGQFGEGHLFFAAPLPYSRLELDVLQLAPRKTVRTVLVDNGDGLARLAARRLHDLGYSRVFILEGGVNGWNEAGFTLFKGVNLPSKTFGELVEHAYDTPHITATQLLALRATGSKIAMLDGRTVEEHHKMTIPGSTSCPNGELAYRLNTLVADDDTTIVINCAGRTRSIIGAQTLRNLGIPNPVLALENGTQGWYLAGLELEHGSTLRYPEQSSGDLPTMRQAADALLRRFAVPVLTATQAQDWLDDEERTTFLFDVRTEQEFLQGSIAGARHAAGGQLIQATDQYLGVRKSRLILLNDDGVRAPVVASWLHQLGFEVAVTVGDLRTSLHSAAPATLPVNQPLLRIGAAELQRLKASGNPVTLIDLRPSASYRHSHPEGAIWSIRPILVDTLRRTADNSAPILLLTDTPEIAEIAALDLREAGYANLALAQHGTLSFEAAGFALQATPSQPADADRIDYLFFVHDRHEGNREAAKKYLDWETGLVAQCTADELAAFRLPAD